LYVSHGAFSFVGNALQIWPFAGVLWCVHLNPIETGRAHMGITQRENTAVSHFRRGAEQTCPDAAMQIGGRFQHIVPIGGGWKEYQAFRNPIG